MQYPYQEQSLFWNVDKDNLLMSVEDLKKLTNKTKVILPVHVSGRGSNIKKS